MNNNAKSLIKYKYHGLIIFVLFVFALFYVLDYWPNNDTNSIPNHQTIADTGQAPVSYKQDIKHYWITVELFVTAVMTLPAS